MVNIPYIKGSRADSEQRHVSEQLLKLQIYVFSLPGKWFNYSIYAKLAGMQLQAESPRVQSGGLGVDCSKGEPSRYISSEYYIVEGRMLGSYAAVSK